MELLHRTDQGSCGECVSKVKKKVKKMSDSYRQFSVSISLKSDEEFEWLNGLLAAIEDAPDLNLEFYGSDESDGRGRIPARFQHTADWKEFTDKVGIEMTDIVKAVAYGYGDSKGSYGQIGLFNVTLEGQKQGVLHLYENEGCDIEKPVELIHAFLKRFRPTDTCILSWADTCSKKHNNAFGGNEVLITGDWVFWPPSILERMASVYTKSKQAGQSMTAKEAVSACRDAE